MADPDKLDSTRFLKEKTSESCLGVRQKIHLDLSVKGR